ncbi:MAG: type II toxin-antitoxin system HicA family toxin [Candidatus Dormibacteria bacterium]
MKYRDLRRRLKSEGFEVVARDGSHEQWKHPDRPGRVTVSGKSRRDVPNGTLRNIFRQAGWKWR